MHPKVQRRRQDNPFLNPFGRVSRLLHSLPLKQNGEGSRSSLPDLQRNKVPEKEVDNFIKLGDIISELVEMMGGGRRPIHQAMRDLVASISSLYQQAGKDKDEEQKQKVRTNDRSPQTTVDILCLQEAEG